VRKRESDPGHVLHQGQGRFDEILEVAIVALPEVEAHPRMTSTKLSGSLPTGPSAHVAKVHDRQVVTLQPDQFAAWLDGSAGTEILAPAPEEAIRYWPVSKRINKVSAPQDDKTLIEPVTLEPESGTSLLI